jgi:hypothetical protein
MSKQSERVKKWRKTCKDRIITAMGGKCCICGYDRCSQSLALHHLDPAQKDFGFGQVMANPKNWDALAQELRKCVLICHNCHNEVHAGMAVVPLDAPCFNEEFSDYKSLQDTIPEVLDNCPVCGKLKPAHQKNCSLECTGISRYKVDWDGIDLPEELKTKSIVQLAEEFGCSDAAIHKRMKKLGLK